MKNRFLHSALFSISVAFIYSIIFTSYYIVFFDNGGGNIEIM